MDTMTIALVGGAFGYLCIAAAVLTGLRVIKVKVKVHKAIGIIVAVGATLHGIGGLLIYLGAI
jgi:hypothetical protein